MCVFPCWAAEKHISSTMQTGTYCNNCYGFNIMTLAKYENLLLHSLTALNLQNYIYHLISFHLSLLFTFPLSSFHTSYPMIVSIALRLSSLVSSKYWMIPSRVFMNGSFGYFRNARNLYVTLWQGVSITALIPVVVFSLIAWSPEDEASGMASLSPRLLQFLYKKYGFKRPFSFVECTSASWISLARALLGDINGPQKNTSNISNSSFCSSFGSDSQIDTCPQITPNYLFRITVPHT